MPFKISLESGYVIQEITRQQVGEISRAQGGKVFSSTVDFQMGRVLSASEREKLMQLDGNLTGAMSIAVGFYYEGEMIGWHYGSQESQGRFYMVETGILPEHRGKGIYSAFLLPFVEYLKTLGFQEIYSKHNCTNNAVLVPKLKAGFVVSGFQISDVFGLMLELTYFTNESRRQVVKFRSGQESLDEKLLPLVRVGKQESTEGNKGAN